MESKRESSPLTLFSTTHFGRGDQMSETRHDKRLLARISWEISERLLQGQTEFKDLEEQFPQFRGEIRELVAVQQGVKSFADRVRSTVGSPRAASRKHPR
jgi:hypothetical protein